VKADYRFGRGLARIILKWVLGVRWIGSEVVPMTGPLLVVPNHRSYLDPPLVGCGLTRELYFFAKAELFTIPLLGRAVRVFNSIPVKRGRADRRALSIAIESVRSGGALVLFPEGTRAPKGEFLPPKLGVGMIAARCRVPVYPVYISGTGEGIGRVLRSVLRVEPIRVLYGSPIDIDELERQAGDDGDHAAQYERMAVVIMSVLARLKERLEGAPDRGSGVGGP